MNAEQIEKRESVLLLMKQAGLERRVDMAALFRFAELVTAAERERCALIAENYPRADPDTCDLIAAAIRNTAAGHTGPASGDQPPGPNSKG